MYQDVRMRLKELHIPPFINYLKAQGGCAVPMRHILSINEEVSMLKAHHQVLEKGGTIKGYF